MRRRTSSVGAAAALVLALTVSACGSSGGSANPAPATGAPETSATASSSAPAPTDTSGVSIEKYLSPPTTIPITTPLSKKPAAGKTIIVTENPQAVTRKTNDGLEKGAALLGWTVKRQPIGTSPEDPAKALDAALDQKPDAIYASGNPAATLRTQLERAKSMKIPVILSDSGDPVGVDGSVYTIALDDFNQTKLWGKLTADYAISKKAKHVLVVNLSLYPILNAYSEGVVAELKTASPDTKSTLIDTQIGDFIAGKVPANVVSELQRSPDIDWVFLALGDMSTGLKAALRSSGFGDKVKIGGESASTANVAALKSKDEDAWTGFAAEIHGMYRIDALARIFNGDPLDPKVYSQLPTQLLTQDNIAQAPLDAEGYYVGLPNYVDLFSKLWKVTG